MFIFNSLFLGTSTLRTLTLESLATCYVGVFLISFSVCVSFMSFSFSCNSMFCIGGSTLVELNPSFKKNLSKVACDRKIISEFTRSISSKRVS